MHRAGHDATHVRDCGLHASSDGVGLARAAAEHRILGSADTDFGALKALRGEGDPSMVLLRMTTRHRPHQQLAILVANLPALEVPLTRGSLVVFEESRIRVRTLPMDSRT